jgi:hypothetical protein
MRGAVNSLNFLANGYKQKVIDLSECLRSFTLADVFASGIELLIELLSATTHTHFRQLFQPTATVAR